MNIIHVVDKLEEHALNDKLVRCIMKLQGDSEASVRTNSTIFLGKIIPKLKEPARLRIVGNYFSKAMKGMILNNVTGFFFSLLLLFIILYF